MYQPLSSRSNKSQAKNSNIHNITQSMGHYIAYAVKIIKLLTSKRKALFYFILEFYKNERICFATAEYMYKKIEERQGVSESTCKRAMKELRDAGILIYRKDHNLNKDVYEIAAYLFDIDISNPPPLVKIILRDMEKACFGKRKEAQKKELLMFLEMKEKGWAETSSQDINNQSHMNECDPLFEPPKYTSNRKNIRIEVPPDPIPPIRSGKPTLLYGSRFPSTNNNFKCHQKQVKIGTDVLYFLREKCSFIPEEEYYTLEGCSLADLEYAGHRCYQRSRKEVVKKLGKIDKPKGYFVHMAKTHKEKRKKAYK